MISMVGVRCFVFGDDGKHHFRPRGQTEAMRPMFEGQNNRIKTAIAPLFSKDNSDEKKHGSVPVPETPAQGAIASSVSTNYPGNWPCFDKMDKELIKISLPVIGNYAINPLIGAVDLFWVNRMGNALAVAGQAAANQVFSSAFWFTSFLPSGKNTREPANPQICIF